MLKHFTGQSEILTSTVPLVWKMSVVIKNQVEIFIKVCKMEQADLFTGMIEEALRSGSYGDIYRSVIDSTERSLIEKALRRVGGNQIMAARLLGINRNTLRAKIKKLKIDKEQFKHE